MKTNHKTLALACLAAGVMIVGALSVRAQETNLEDIQGPNDEAVAKSGITFPIPGLGNCESKEACKSYCDDPANVEACIAFAEERGLMKKEEAARAKQFSKTIREKSGPGGCNSPKSCEAYCGNLDHIDECLAFAEGQGISGKHIEQGKKMREFLKKGGVTPGGCNSKGSCETYCSDFSHGEECLAFAEAAGIEPDAEIEGTEGAPKPTRETMKKFIELSKTGETPGACKSKTECEAYCSGDEHFEECRAFGEKLGFSPPPGAMEGPNGRPAGPGGCNSHESCATFCSDSANVETCLQFSKQHGIEERVEHFGEVKKRFEQGEFHEEGFRGRPEGEGDFGRGFRPDDPGASECGRLAAEAGGENSNSDARLKMEECVRRMIEEKAGSRTQIFEDHRENLPPQFRPDEEKDIRRQIEAERQRTEEGTRRDFVPPTDSFIHEGTGDVIPAEGFRPREDFQPPTDSFIHEGTGEIKPAEGFVPSSPPPSPSASGEFHESQTFTAPSGSFEPVPTSEPMPTPLPSSEPQPAPAPTSEPMPAPSHSEPTSWRAPSLVGAVLGPFLEVFSPRRR